MADYLTTDTELTSIANAIRTKGGTSAALTYPADFVSAINAIPTGGGGGVEEKQINFVDYDGTILYSYTKAQINAMTSESDLPANPSHTGLTARGWNWTLAQIKANLLDMPYGDVWVGQMYATSDGKTRVYFRLEGDNSLSPYLALCVNGSVTIDWGDNSSTETLTGTGLATIKYTQHTYPSAGDYILTLDVTGKIKFPGSANNACGILRSDASTNSTTRNRSWVYVNAIKKLEIGNNVFLGTYSLDSHNNLESIILPPEVELEGNFITTNYILKHLTFPNTIPENQSGYLVQSCYALRTISLPGNLKTMGYGLRSSNTLKSVSVPYGLTSLGDYSFNALYCLPKLYIPSTVTSLGSYLFSTCRQLTELTIPANVSSIAAYAFSNCYCLKEYHLLPTTPPTLANSNAFSGINPNCVIYVPYSADHSILNTYKTASQWSTYASYMQEEPQ